MDAGSLSTDVLRSILERRALLWVCQRHDLIPNAEPHDYGVLPAEAVHLYRTRPSHADDAIAALYWEAVWLEGAASPLLSTLEARAAKTPPDKRRMVVKLAGTADAEAVVPTSSYLPVAILPGLLGDAASADARYGAKGKRARVQTALQLAFRLGDYPARTLVVLGARQDSDLDMLSEALEILQDDGRLPPTGMQVLLVWPSDGRPPAFPSAVRVDEWYGDETALAEYLAQAGAPAAEAVQKWTIRVRDRSVSLTPRELDRLARTFAIPTEQELQAPDSLDMSDVEDFLSGRLHSWAAYAAGLPIPRSYKCGEQQSVSEKALGKLAALAHQKESDRGARSKDLHWLRIPAEPGSGATTLLRMTAFQTAKAGYPTLLLRPNQSDVDIEQVRAFTVHLAEQAAQSGVKELPPLVVAIDAEHSDAGQLSQLPQVLESDAKRVLMIQVLPAAQVENGDGDTTARRRQDCEPVLSSIAADDEVRSCAEKFADAIRQYRLPIETLTLADWQRYANSIRWESPGEVDGSQPRSMFWVALRFFLTEGMDFSSAEKARDGLGRWIEKRSRGLEDSLAGSFLTCVAALSSFRIDCPLWTAVRTVCDGAMTQEVVDLFHELDGIIEWGNKVEQIDDYTVRFLHPAIALEYLRKLEVRGEAARASLLNGCLSGLTVQKGDVWLAEKLASKVLAPEYERRQLGDWEWRLEAFEHIPPVVRDYSSVVLHHWARCLYLSAERESETLTLEERRSRYETAVSKLRKAIDVQPTQGHAEHPSRLYNTLGTALSRYAGFLENNFLASDTSDLWEESFESLRTAAALGGGQSVEPALAYCHALERRWGDRIGKAGEPPQEMIEDFAEALGLLDEAEEALDHYASPDPNWYPSIQSRRAYVLSFMDSRAARAFIEQLKASQDPALGYYCQARLEAGDLSDKGNRDRALSVLQQAEVDGVSLDYRSLSLWVTLLMRDESSRHNFRLLRNLLERLELASGKTLRPRERFRLAVLCYQTGDFEQGERRFRNIREAVRHQEMPQVPMSDWWWDESFPEQPGLTTVRVRRIITEYSAEGEVEAFAGASVRLQPRNFIPQPRINDTAPCRIRFTIWGPMAVPTRFGPPERKKRQR